MGALTQMQVDYFFSVISPWVYLSGTRLQDIAARHGATIAYHPVDLGGLFPRTGGQALADRHESRRAYRLQELVRWSQRLDLPLNPRPAFFPVNPAPASFAVIAASKAGGGDMGALIHGLGRALWAEDRDISDDSVIGDCLEAAGFARSLGGWQALTEAETFARNLEEAVRRGVFGVPTYLLGDQMFWGQDRLDFLDAALASA
jgi:2-hydroxychromene-2-carboxylate isomerase